MKRGRNNANNGSNKQQQHRTHETLRRMELRGLLRDLERQAAQATTQADQMHYYRRIMAVRKALAK